MARLPRPEPVTDAVRQYGLLAHAPAVLERFMRLYGTLWQDGIVDPATKEVVRLRNARTTGCGYCRNVRFASAREGGLTEERVALIDDGWAASALSAREKAAIALTDVVLGRTAAVDGALASALRREFTAPELVELGVTAALCLGFSKIAVALGTAPVDMPTTVVPTPVPPPDPLA
jgi:AhpD family alkylhydroperoxidase